MGVSQFTIASGGITLEGVNIDEGVIDLNGVANSLILDADGDTSISSPLDDQIDFELGGADDFSMTANSFNVLAGSVIAGPSSTFYWCAPIAVQQALSGAGAINITSSFTAWTSTGTNAGTLIDGVVKGQYKKIQMIVDAGVATLTPTNLSGGTKITFSDVGDTAELVFNGTNWVAVALYNITDGTSAPVLS